LAGDCEPSNCFAAMHLLTTTLVFGGRFAEGYAIANDFEQAQGRVFRAVRRICEVSPHLHRECSGGFFSE
jgi:hypothetical protein